MALEICKWKNDASSPFLFWIDELTDAWVGTRGNTVYMDSGYMAGDWGRYGNDDRSAFSFLMDKILSADPGLKTTLFVSAGPVNPVVKFPVFPFYSNRIDDSEYMRNFLRWIAQDQMFELAYCGTTYGKIGESDSEFIYEWETFKDLEQAVDTVKRGKGVLEAVSGTSVRGGKYCGHRKGEFGEGSVEICGFDWWCSADVSGTLYPVIKYGNPDRDMDIKFDIARFGSRGVVDIPTTVDGSMFNSALSPNWGPRGIAKRIFKERLISKGIERLEHLIERKLVISVKERLSPVCGDREIQSPNIFTDCKGLLLIIDYLRGKNVWRCTASELCDYVNLRDNSSIQREGRTFRIAADYEWIYGNIKDRVLSIKCDAASMIIQPDGKEAMYSDGVFNINVMDGEYRVYE